MKVYVAWIRYVTDKQAEILVDLFGDDNVSELPRGLCELVAKRRENPNVPAAEAAHHDL